MEKKIGFFLTCDQNGYIIDIGSDEFGLLKESYIESLYDIVEESSRDKINDFLEQIKEQGVALLWEIGLVVDGVWEIFNFFGGRSQNSVFVFAGKAPQNIFTLYDELLRIINEQAVNIRQLQSASSKGPIINEAEKRAAKTPQAVDNAAYTAGTGNAAGAARTQGAKDKKTAKKAETAHDFTSTQLDLNAFTELTNALSLAQRDLAQKNYMLKMQEKRFSKIISHSLDAIIIVDKENIIHFANPAAEKLLQKSEQELLGTYFPHPCQNNQKECSEIAFEQLNDKPVICSVRTVPISWEDEPVTMVTLTDITAQKEMEKLKNDVETIMRHDLKTPLNGIMGVPQLLLASDNLTPEQREYIELLWESGKKMNDMIGNSLTILKIEQGTYQYTPYEFDMLKVMNQAIADLAGHADNVDSLITVQTNGFSGPDTSNPDHTGESHDLPETVAVNGEELLTYSILSNLIKNALEANTDAETVTIFLARENTLLKLSVHNSGMVPEEIQATFFDKYTTSGKNNRGMGLGTYIIKKLADLQGWSVSMQTSSQAGTTITLYIPLPK